MLKTFSEIIIPALWNWPDIIVVSEKFNLTLQNIWIIQDDITFYKAEMRSPDELITSDNYLNLLAKYSNKTNLLKLFCFLENPYFNNEFFIQWANPEELKSIWQNIIVSWLVLKDQREFHLKHREFRPYAFWGVTKIDSIEVTWFRYLVDDVFQIKENDFNFILEMIWATFDASNVKVKFLLLSSLLEYIVISDSSNNKDKTPEDSIAQRYAQRLSIIQERYIFYKREIDKDEEYKYLTHSWESAYKEIKLLYDIRSCIIHWNLSKLESILSRKINWEKVDLTFYYRNLAFIAKYAIELFITDKQFLSLITGFER